MRNKKQNLEKQSVTSIRNFFEKQAAKTAIGEQSVGGPVHPQDERDQAVQGDGVEEREQQEPQNNLFPGPANPSRTKSSQAQNNQQCTPTTRPKNNPTCNQKYGQPVHSKK